MSGNPAVLLRKHQDALDHWYEDRNHLRDELAQLTVREHEERLVYQQQNPSARSDGVGKPVNELRRKIDTLATRLTNLDKDIKAKEQIVEGLLAEKADQDRVTEEARNRELVNEAVRDVTARWVEFMELAVRLRQQWPEVVLAVERLDRLPAGEAPLRAFPRDLEAAINEALRGVDGEDSFVHDPRVNARRIETKGARSTASDHTRFTRDMHGLSWSTTPQ